MTYSGDTETGAWVPMAAGVRRLTLAHGPRLMQMLVEFEGGSHLPEHRHAHEQVVHVVAGRLRLVVAGEAHEVGAGQSLYLAGDVPHAVDALEATRAVDTFSPPREDLLAQDREAAQP